jgi:hypothetical protein
MPVMNIIYACDVLEKRKKEKILRWEQKPLLSVKGAPITVGGTVLRQEQKAQLSAKSPLQREPNVWLSVKRPPSTRAKYLAIGEEPFFNESQIFGSRQRSGPHS